MNDNLALGLIGLLILFFIAGLFLSRYGNNKSIEIEMTFDQIKDYFYKKHNCKNCNIKLKRIRRDDYQGEGWTSNFGSSSYSKKYRRTYYLKCPNCNRNYTSDDF